METIKPGKYVELVYNLYEIADEGEELMYSFSENQPDRFVFGIGGEMLPAFAAAIEGKTAGDKFDITLAPEDAFGLVQDDYVMEFERKMFEINGEFDHERIQPGNTIEMMTPEGHRIPGDVVEVKDDKVVIDFNHPLAGQTVHFVGKVKTVREATAEELNPHHGCGCNCHHDKDGGCGCEKENDNCGCGDDCKCGC